MKAMKIILTAMLAAALVFGCNAAAEEANMCENGCTPSDWVKKADPTCTEGTYQIRYLCTVSDCMNYNKLWDTRYLDDELGHAWTEKGEGDIAPTCTEPGLKNYFCGRACEATKTETVKATGHNMIAVTETAATCVKNGSAILKCDKNCGATETKVLPATGKHTWVDVAGKAPSCGDDGYSDHQQCSVCEKTAGKVVIPAETAHEWEKKKVVEPTCTEKGHEVWKCKECKKTEKRNEVAKLGHNYTQMIDHMEPTCETEGYEVKQCSRCTETKTSKIGTTAHNYTEAGWTNRLDASCTSEGLAYRVCTNCGGAEQTKAIPALGHRMAKDPHVVKEPTCTKAGEGYKYCERCTLHETVVIPALGHKERKDVVVPATCTDAGMQHIWCETCEELLKKNVEIPALGHKGEVIKTVPATCAAEGSKTTKCDRCQKTATEPIAKLPHKYGWVVVVKPTETAHGRNDYKCSACGEVKESKVVRYTKYYYNNSMTSYGPMTRELVGGNDWYRVTPVDLTVDGEYVYDLIASNRYVVGKVFISVTGNVLRVSYMIAADHIQIKEETLLFYATKSDLADGLAVEGKIGMPIDIAATFGEDEQVLVSLILIGDYNAAGYNVELMKVDEDEISEMIEAIK